MLTIKIAGPSDAALIADMSRQTFYDTFAGQNSKENMNKFMTEQFSREKLSDEVGEAGNIFLLAYDDDVPAGYAQLRESDNPPGLGNTSSIEIARIYAATNAIGKGVGKALMQRCIDLAAGMKKKIIWLGVWEHNERAIAFYIKWGFEKFGTHVFLLGDDPQTDWLMKKQLTQVR
ncbi:MAG TPA: GNAT family N-acetyltransferase [Chitinophagaceae bacterium]|nr:GNAT family N-acetyltransferase [Chitinophagaceae bacterium]